MKVITSPIGFLRPGEAALKENQKHVECGEGVEGNNKIIVHPTRKPTTNCVNIRDGVTAGIPNWPAASRPEDPPVDLALDRGMETWDNILMENPVEVVIEGRFVPMLKIFGTWPISVSQQGFRRSRLERNYKGTVPEDPEVVPMNYSDTNNNGNVDGPYNIPWPNPEPLATEVPLPSVKEGDFCNVIESNQWMCDAVNCFTNRWRCDRCGHACFGGS